jgi:hypothetical protein
LAHRDKTQGLARRLRRNRQESRASAWVCGFCLPFFLPPMDADFAPMDADKGQGKSLRICSLTNRAP